MSQTTGQATILNALELASLRERADSEATACGGFIDPRRMNIILGWWRSDLAEWAAAVTGRATVVNLRHLPWHDWLLLDLARVVEPNPPPPPRLTARRAAKAAAQAEHEAAQAAERQAKAAEWAVLVEALPVKVYVAHNYTSVRHFEFYVQGGEHILLDEDLHVGRLHRKARRPLCYVPSRARDLRHFPNWDDPLDRVPSCHACLRTAYRVSGREPNGLLP